jgi:hypothetical protein
VLSSSSDSTAASNSTGGTECSCFLRDMALYFSALGAGFGVALLLGLPHLD